MNPAGRKTNKFYPGIENVIPALQEELLFVVSEDHKNSTFVISQPVYLTGEYMCEKRASNETYGSFTLRETDSDSDSCPT